MRENFTVLRLLHRLLITCFVLSVSSECLVAQTDPDAATLIISGLVIDSETSEPIVGVAVICVAKNAFAVTDREGRFAMDLQRGDVISIEMLGYQSHSITIADNRSLTIALQPSETRIEEVVVTGYQVISKERATGSFDILSNKVLENPSDNIAQRMVGKVAGLKTTIKADGSMSMVIRGQGTFLGSDPLYVVDGFAIDGGIGTINPEDVESISVLKDAAAASIWGARASNGVIVITTKKGAKNSLKINYSTFVRIGSKTDLDYLRNYPSSADVVKYEKSLFGKYGYQVIGSQIGASDFGHYVTSVCTQAQTLYNQYASKEITEAQMNAGFDKLASQDNSGQIEKYLLQRPVYQQHSLSLSGGNDRMTNYVSMLYGHNRSYYKESSDENLQFDYRGTVKAFKWLDLNLFVMTRYSTVDSSGVNDGTITSLAPYDMLLNDDGTLADMSYTQYYKPMIDRMVPKDKFPYSDWSYNPIQEIQNRDLRSSVMRNRVQVGLTFKIIDGLTFDTKYHYERANSESRYLYTDQTYYVRNTVNTASTWDMATDKVTQNIPSGNILTQQTNVIRDNYDFRNQINFNRTFAQVHNINFVGGVEWIRYRKTGHTSPTTYGYDDDQLTAGLFPNGTQALVNWINVKKDYGYVNTYSHTTELYLSKYANLSYTYDGKYSISGSFRDDAANYITDDPTYRHSPFWSIGGMWLISEEPFLNTSTIVNHLKLRATYGYNGISDNSASSRTLITITGTNSKTGYLEAKIVDFGNPSLRWERTGTFNVGIDFDLFSHKLYGKIDFYNKYGKDILANVSVPMATGTTSATFNHAEILNRGIEIELGSQITIAKDFVWNGDVTFSYNDNKVKKLFRANYPYWHLTGSGGTVYVEGMPISAVYSYRYGGVQNVGTSTSPLYRPVVKLVGDEVMPFGGSTSYDGLQILGYQGMRVAPYVVGMSHSFVYRGLSLAFTLTGEFGHIFRRTGFNYSKKYPNGQLHEIYDNDSLKIAPMPLNNENLWSSGITGYLDYLTTSASNVRMQELSLSYDLPQRIISYLHFSRATVYAQGNNLFTIKSIAEDPVYHYGTRRLMPSYTFGLKVQF